MKYLAILTLTAMLAGPALAEPPTGSRLGQRNISGLQYTEEQADEGSTKLAQCMVTKRSAAARTYIDALTQEEANQATRVLFKDISCMSFVGLSDMSDSAAFNVPRDVMRGKLAEALLKNQSSGISALPALPLVKDYSRPWFAATGRSPVIDEMAVCVVDTNPRGVAGVLATRGYSKEEGVAFGAVMPSLGTCLRVGAKLQANRQALRAALADALYQRLTRPAPAAQFAAAEAATQQARIAYKKFAECVVGKYSQDAQIYVIEDLSEQETTRLRNKMLDGACWRASTGLQPPIATTGLKLQGMIAEVLMAAEATRGPLQDVKNVAPLNHEPVNAAERRRADPDTLKFMDTMYSLFKAGECVVRADVNGADRLLKSGLATPEESEALAALKPAFEGCPKWDSSFAASIDELRATIAANYYRLSHAPRLASSAKEAAK